MYNQIVNNGREGQRYQFIRPVASQFVDNEITE